MSRFKLYVLALAVLALLASCAPAPAATPTGVAATPTTGAAVTPTPGAGAETPTATSLPTGGLRTPEEAALEAAGGEQIGGTVSVLAVWGGDEQDSFMAMIEPFQQATGIQIQYTGTRDIAAVLTTRLQAGNPPDLAGLPGPGQMAEYAAANQLVDLGQVLDVDAYNSQYAETWRTLGTVDDTLVGVFIKASLKGLIWYRPELWAQQGYTIPATWDDLIALSNTIAETGTTPWSEALEAAAASGWPGTDWLEDIVLRQSGREVYESWYRGEIRWTSPEIRRAWETWGEIVGNPEMVYGGVNTMLTTNFEQVGVPLFTDPPNAYLVHQASFITALFEANSPGIEAGTDYDFFPFPKFEASAPDQSVIAGDLFGMFNDTPQARALIKYLLTPEAQAIWVRRGGAISPNNQVPVSEYPDDLTRAIGERITSLPEAVFDASDLMPEAMNNAFWQGILDFVQNPDNLDSILQRLDTVQADAYSQ